jgi:hypothetical protein
MQQQQQFQILVANESHYRFAQTICDEMAESAKAREQGLPNVLLNTSSRR